MYKSLGKLTVLFSLLLAFVSARAADGTTKPAVQARQEMEARSAEIYTHAMNASNAASHYAEQQVAAGKKEYVIVAQSCADCADMAGMAAKFTARNSPMAGQAREAFAMCCDHTVAELEKLNDPELTACMEACKSAGKDCRDMQKVR